MIEAIADGADGVAVAGIERGARVRRKVVRVREVAVDGHGVGVPAEETVVGGDLGDAHGELGGG